MSSLSPAIASSKAQQIPSAPNLSSSAQNDQQSAQQRGSFSNNNNSNSSGGSGSAYRANQGLPKGNQAGRSRHKPHRKPSMQRDDIIADALAMTSTGSKKGRTSITHLMDWSTPLRPQNYGHHNHYSHQSFRGGSKRPSWGLGSGYHAVDKARYVNANYRFVVHPDGDYRPQILDPDAHIQWTSALQIVASMETQSTACPICLCDPVAPRMAKCGHIFCLPCLLRYMASSPEDDKMAKFPLEKRQRWKKCPICYDHIYVAETKPVKFTIGQGNAQPREGSDIVLRLMVRDPGSTLALPREVANNFGNSSKRQKLDHDSIPWHFAAEITDYARIMKGTEKYMTAEFNREIAELQEMSRHDELMFGEEGDWVRKAIGKINGSIESLAGMAGPDIEEEEEKPEPPKVEKPPIIWNQGETEVPDMYLHATASNSGLAIPMLDESRPEVKQEAAKQNIKPEQPARRPVSPESPRRTRAKKIFADTHDPSQPYYFYQALPHTYLSPLDIRILKVAFGSFPAFPSTILPRVENFSPGHVVDDDLRKRAKYLSHLPYGCEVAFLECDWTDIVSAEVLEKFDSEIERRRKKKKEKDVREERDRIRAEREEEEKRWAAARIKRRVTEEEIEYKDEEGSGASLHVPPIGDLSIEDPPTEFWNRDEERLGFDSLPQSSPPDSRTVWGTPAIPTQFPEEFIPKATPTKSNQQGWLDDWETMLLLQHQQAANFEVAGGGESSAVGAVTGGGGASKGKKKFKKVTLMTNTGLRRA